MRFLGASLLCIALIAGGCAYPSTSVDVSDNRPTIAVKGASANSVLHVDGLSMGLANKYNGSPNVLLVEPGTHKIEIIDNGKTALSQKVFLGEGENRTFSVGTVGGGR